MKLDLGFTGWLTLAFIILKLTGVIGWSWWWVLAPLWITMGLVGLVAILAGLVNAVRK